MNNRWFPFLFIFALLTIAIFYLMRVSSITTINYFPIDNETSFTYATTSLTTTPNENDASYSVTWKTSSKSSKSMYLRQDVSLLYDNGALRGVRSKWLENTDSITFQETIIGKKSSFLQAISYHHGEIHYPNDKIKSSQVMSQDHLYIVDNLKKIQKQFKIPQSELEVQWKQELEYSTKKTLLSNWDGLIHHFHVNMEEYLTVPLTELYKYNNESIPSLTNNETQKVIGQLWEGIYKNYVLPVANSKSDNNKNIMPIILFDKNNTHLLVLFELNGKKEKLIQQYSK